MSIIGWWDELRDAVRERIREWLGVEDLRKWVDARCDSAAGVVAANGAAITDVERSIVKLDVALAKLSAHVEELKIDGGTASRLDAMGYRLDAIDKWATCRLDTIDKWITLCSACSDGSPVASQPKLTTGSLEKKTGKPRKRKK